MPGPRTMRSSSSCPSTPPRSRSSSSARPRKRGPSPSSSIAYAIPPPTVKTPLNLVMPVSTLSRWTACTARSMGTWPPTSLPCSDTSGSKEERPRILLPPANPSARPFGKGTASASSSSSHQDCLDSEEKEMQQLKPESMGDKPSSSSPSSSCKQQSTQANITERSSSSSPKPKEIQEKLEERKYSKSAGRNNVRKLQEAIMMSTSSGRKEYLPVNNVEIYLHKPGLEAEPGATALPPSRARIIFTLSSNGTVTTVLHHRG